MRIISDGIYYFLCVSLASSKSSRSPRPQAATYSTRSASSVRAHPTSQSTSLNLHGLRPSLTVSPAPASASVRSSPIRALHGAALTSEPSSPVRLLDRIPRRADDVRQRDCHRGYRRPPGGRQIRGQGDPRRAVRVPLDQRAAPSQLGCYSMYVLFTFRAARGPSRGECAYYTRVLTGLRCSHDRQECL